MVDTGLPAAPQPQGLYAAAVVHGRLAISAGMTPREHGRLVVVGTVGDEVSVEVASAAAGLAAANALSAIADSVGGIGNISQCLRMTVYVACRPGFTSLSAVADGASARLHDLLGERAMAARSAIGVASLPSGAPIEVELMAAVSAS